MKISDLFSLLDKLDASVGWFFDFLSYFFAAVLILVFLVYLVKLWRKEINWLGQPILPELENVQHEDNTELLKINAILTKELEEAMTELAKAKKEVETLHSLCQELDQKYDDETYTISQIMYTASEVAAAMYDLDNFFENRDDIYDNLLDYLINTLRGFREKNPRIVIHTKHPSKEGHLIHFAHSSGYTHRVKEYTPPIHGSAAGRAWRTQDVYYLPDVESDEYEYERKPKSSRIYRTLLCVPINVGTEFNSCIGVLSLTGTPVNAYEKIEIERVVLFSKLLYPLILTDLRKREVKTHPELGSEKGT